MSDNPLKARWQAGEVTFGVWGTIDSAFTAELIASEGPDFLCIDQQHGLVDYQMMVAAFQGIRASNGVPITRVATNEPALIGKALDAGAVAVILPMVENAEQVAALAAAFRYQPRGRRSFGPVRAGMTIGSTAIDSLEDVACIPMIETAEGLANLDAIASADGVDALYIGPADLCLSLGLPPTFDRQEDAYQEAVDRVLTACRKHNITAGIQCTDGAMAKHYAERGFQLVTVASDANTLRRAVRTQLDAALGREATTVSGGYS
jgi:4-hydroxy-2-oxoheptanedioate aldolase